MEPLPPPGSPPRRLQPLGAGPRSVADAEGNAAAAGRFWTDTDQPQQPPQQRPAVSAEDDAAIQGMSIAQLRGFISAAGLAYADCIEKPELQERAREAAATGKAVASLFSPAPEPAPARPPPVPPAAAASARASYVPAAPAPAPAGRGGRSPNNQLGLGRVKISASAMAMLESNRRWVRAVQLVAVAVGAVMFTMGSSSLFALVMHHISAGESVLEPWWHNMFIGIPGGAFLILIAPMFGEFILSLQVASALAADAVIEVVRSAKHTSPDDAEQWEAEVAQPALALVATMRHLSSGWSRGLAAAYVGLWSLAVGFFVTTMVFFAMFPAMGVVCAAILLLLLVLPLWMSKAVANVSTSCDVLADTINDRRIEDLDRSPRLLALELALKNLNGTPQRCPQLCSVQYSPVSSRLT